MKKFLIIISLFCFGSALVACSNKNETEMDVLIKERTAIVAEITRIVDADPSLTGVEKAQAYFDTRKVNYYAMAKKIREMKLEELPPDLRKRYEEVSEKAVGEIQSRLSMHKGKDTWDDKAKEKYAELIADYKGVGKSGN